MLIINGQEYASWDDVPEDVRGQLAHLRDADRNGIPDDIEGSAYASVQVHGEDTNVMTVHGDMSEVPPELREKMMAMLAGGAHEGALADLGDIFGDKEPQRHAGPQDAATRVTPPQDARPQDARPHDAAPQDAVVAPPLYPQPKSWWQRLRGGS